MNQRARYGTISMIEDCCELVKVFGKKNVEASGSACKFEMTPNSGYAHIGPASLMLFQ